MSEPVVRLKQGREKPVRHGHPWIFSGAIDRLPDSVGAGEIVTIAAADGSFLARGYANPSCPITVRVLTRRDESIDASFVDHRLAQAHVSRRAILPADTNAFRLINGEADGLPGVIIDVYDDTVVLQCLTAGAERLRPHLLSSLVSRLNPSCVWERSVGAVRKEEGLTSFEGARIGSLTAQPMKIRERGLSFFVDVERGQKTGFFLDQRDNRQLARTLAQGRRVLNAFSYSGAASVAAAAGGAAHVVSVDSSASALVLARRNWEENPTTATSEWIEADVFDYLRQTSDEFDLLILDPPALIKRRHDVDRGCRAYKDLHLQALRRAPKGSLLLTFSCSQHLSRDLFVKVVHGAAADFGADLQVLQHLSAAPDHPYSLAQPEGEYLKGLLLRVR